MTWRLFKARKALRHGKVPEHLPRHLRGNGDDGRAWRKVLAVAFAGAVVLGVGAGAAYGYFTSGGSGTGSASTGTLQPVTVAALAGGDAPSSLLTPGGPATDVILRVNNPNASSVTLVSVLGNGTITSNNGSCTTTGVSFANQTSLNISVPNGTSLVDLPGAASMSASSSNGCQGATFSIPVSITVHQG